MVLCGCSTLIESVSENRSDSAKYDFRKSRWGDHIGVVKLSERGLRPIIQREYLLVYKARIYDIPVHIVYCFNDDQRLQASGYISAIPVRTVRLRSEAINLHGNPDYTMYDAMKWQDGRSIIYLHMAPPREGFTQPEYIQSSGALRLPLGNPENNALLWEGVWGYMSNDYAEKLISNPLDARYMMSNYEKRLMGALTKQAAYDWTVYKQTTRMY